MSVLSDRAVASSSSSRFSSSAALARASSRRTVTLSSPARIKLDVAQPQDGRQQHPHLLLQASITAIQDGAAHLADCP